MSLPHSNIEYAVNKDFSRGYCWNFETGCANAPDICKTRETCWAKERVAPRCRGRYGDFTPKFHEDIFNLSFPRKPGARILVCFTGDISYAPLGQIYKARNRISLYPEHTFILLTKRPKEAYCDIAWPRNAWLGVSLTGAEIPERQQQVMDELRAVEGQHKRWISYEPTLGPLQVSLEGIDWLVMGAQTGKGAVKPELGWLVQAMLPLNNDIPIWFKKNLPDVWFNRPRRQELPQ